MELVPFREASSPVSTKILVSRRVAQTIKLGGLKIDYTQGVSIDREGKNTALNMDMGHYLKGVENKLGDRETKLAQLKRRHLVRSVLVNWEGSGAVKRNRLSATEQKVWRQRQLEKIESLYQQITEQEPNYEAPFIPVQHFPSETKRRLLYEMALGEQEKVKLLAQLKATKVELAELHSQQTMHLAQSIDGLEWLLLSAVGDDEKLVMKAFNALQKEIEGQNPLFDSEEVGRLRGLIVELEKELRAYDK